MMIVKVVNMPVNMYRSTFAQVRCLLRLTYGKTIRNMCAAVAMDIMDYDGTILAS